VPTAGAVAGVVGPHEFHAVEAAVPKEDSLPDIAYDPQALAGLVHAAVPLSMTLYLLVLLLVAVAALIIAIRSLHDDGGDDGHGRGGWGPGGPKTPLPPPPPSGLLLVQVIPAPRPLSRALVSSSLRGSSP
jgi:hypothetical protein